jgi:hypothetical protein
MRCEGRDLGWEGLQMSERGVFAVDRGIWEDPDFPNEPFTEREAFLWLVSEAAWKPHRKRSGSKVVDLERGQVCHSIRFMAEAWQWSKSRVDRFLSRLEKRDTIKRTTGTDPVVVTICKYDAFQRVSLPDRDSSGTQVGTAAGQQRDKLEDRENKEVISPSLRSGEKARKSASSPKGTVLPDSWEPKDRHYEKAAARGQNRAFVNAKADRMRNWALSNQNRAIARKADWDRTFDNWLDEALDKATQAPPREKPRQSGQANFLDIARSTFDAPRSPSHEQPLDGEILNPGSGLQATRYPYLAVVERTGADGRELQPEDYPGERRTFG